MTVHRVTSVFAGFRFPPEVISIAVRWYLRYGLSYRDVEELLAERGITVDHVTVYRWVQRFTPEFIEAARLCRHAPGDRWFADETYVKVAGRWTYLYRAIDQHGQVIDVLLSARRDLAAVRWFFIRALRAGTIPAEVTTDRAPAYPRVLDELIPSALHTVERYANNSIETDHGRLKARLRPMRGLKRDRSARTLAAGHAFVQNLRRGHTPLESMERDAIVQSLLDYQGNKLQAAGSLGMSRATIYRKIHEYGILTPAPQHHITAHLEPHHAAGAAHARRPRAGQGAPDRFPAMASVDHA
jgi:transposase, IS6 family